MSNKQTEAKLRTAVLAAVRDYHEGIYGEKKAFAIGDRIPYGGRVFDATEMEYLVDASLDFWLTAGRYAERFERELATFLGSKYCSLVSSGSSANLLALWRSLRRS